MSKYKEGTEGWVVEGSNVHHFLTGCKSLEEERSTSGKTANHMGFNPQKHTACSVCIENAHISGP